MVFLALNELPPDHHRGPAQWYAVRNGEVLTLDCGAFPTDDPPLSPPPAPGGPAPARVAPAASAWSIGGMALQTDTEPIFVGVADGTACWAIGVTEPVDAPPGARWEPLRALGSLLPASSWAVAGRAVHLVDWARTSRFCGSCGAPTVPSPGERAMRCERCGLRAYPRVAPAIITLVQRGDEVLLARNGRFQGGMFSVLAGFVEPGETLEETVHREVAEEVGVRLHQPRYVASQPWPFPHSLMVGFVADWADGEIEVDGDEIVEAGWYRRDRLPQLPPPLSIARRLIDGWLAGGDPPRGIGASPLPR